MAGARAWILDQLDAERSRWMLWLPVALGLGIAVYFELPSEPALWLGPVLAVAALVLVFFAPAGSLARAVAIGLVAAAVGFGLIAWRTASLAAPTLSRPLFNMNVEGRIADIQRLPEGVRVVLEAVPLKGGGAPPPEMTPVRLRVSLTKGAPPLMATTAARAIRPSSANAATARRARYRYGDSGTACGDAATPERILCTLLGSNIGSGGATCTCATSGRSCGHKDRRAPMDLDAMAAD